ncbi:Cysteine desulfurase [compost metagenome]
MNSLYLDYCASAPMHPKVYEVLMQTSKELFANPSSAHLLGFEVHEIIENSRDYIAKTLGVSSKEIVFTSGATESNNLAIMGVSRAATKMKGGKVHIITSTIEHSSVFNCFKHLEEEGFEVTYIPVDKNGRVSVDIIKKSLRENTALVSIMQVNNETGTIQPIDEIALMLREKKNIYFHVDGVQGFTKTSINLKNIDLYTISGHKIGAPKGIGILLLKEHIQLTPMIFGGGQEDGVRSGTPNVSGIVSITEAIKIGMLEKNEKMRYLKTLYDSLVHRLTDIPEIVINSPGGSLSSPHILNISFNKPGLNSAILINLLSKKGIIASSQSACSSKNSKQSRVLMEMTKDIVISSNSVRFSFSEEVGEAEVDYLVNTLEEIISQVKENGRFAVLT